MDTVRRVYELAGQQDISLYQLAQRSGISVSTIKMTEKRGGQLKIDTIERICEGLGISLAVFFTTQSQNS